MVGYSHNVRSVTYLLSLPLTQRFWSDAPAGEVRCIRWQVYHSKVTSKKSLYAPVLRIQTRKLNHVG